MWVCGLKRQYIRLWSDATYVTPYVGVWIETIKASQELKTMTVTPYVGVWIETVIICIDSEFYHVTPYVGVWIETWRGQEKEI